MHPLGLYLAINDSQRNRSWTSDDERRPAPASAAPDPTADAESERSSRLGRLAALVRRHLAPAVRA